MEKQEFEHRIKNVIILLTDGHPYKVGDLTFGSRDSENFSVTGWTITNDLKHFTKSSALKELAEIPLVYRIGCYRSHSSTQAYIEPQRQKITINNVCT